MKRFVVALELVLSLAGLGRFCRGPAADEPTPTSRCRRLSARPNQVPSGGPDSRARAIFIWATVPSFHAVSRLRQMSSPGAPSASRPKVAGCGGIPPITSVLLF